MLSKHKAKQAIQMSRDGCSIADISEALKVSSGTISNIRSDPQKYGLKGGKQYFRTKGNVQADVPESPARKKQVPKAGDSPISTALEYVGSVMAASEREAKELREEVKNLNLYIGRLQASVVSEIRDRLGHVMSEGDLRELSKIMQQTPGDYKHQ